MIKKRKLERELLKKVKSNSFLEGHFIMMGNYLAHISPLPGSNNRARQIYKALKMKGESTEWESK